MWREEGVCRILKNDKYVGDLTQWKHYSTDFLTKQVLQNNGDNPDTPLITIKEHHEGIISREVWELAKKQVEERGRLAREGRKASSHYWFSSKVFCGKCGYAYNITGKKDKTHRNLKCVNRSKYGNEHRVDANGAEVGCNNIAINEPNIIINEQTSRLIVPTDFPSFKFRYRPKVKHLPSSNIFACCLLSLALIGSPPFSLRSWTARCFDPCCFSIHCLHYFQMCTMANGTLFEISHVYPEPCLWLCGWQ